MPYFLDSEKECELWPYLIILRITSVVITFIELHSYMCEEAYLWVTVGLFTVWQ